MIHLEREHLLDLNASIVKSFEGRAVLLRPAAVDYCLMKMRYAGGRRPRASKIPEMASALLESVIQTQPFADGNKRTAWLAMQVFLGLNDRYLRHDPDEAEKLTRRIANREVAGGEMRSWLRERLGSGSGQ